MMCPNGQLDSLSPRVGTASNGRRGGVEVSSDDIRATSALLSTLVNLLASTPYEGSESDRVIVRVFQPKTPLR
jgi:hypothetical protein